MFKLWTLPADGQINVPFAVNVRSLFVVNVVFGRAAPGPAAAALNDRRSDSVCIAESYSGNEVGTVMFLSLPFH